MHCPFKECIVRMLAPHFKLCIEPVQWNKISYMPLAGIAKHYYMFLVCDACT